MEGGRRGRDGKERKGLPRQDEDLKRGLEEQRQILLFEQAIFQPRNSNRTCKITFLLYSFSIIKVCRIIRFNQLTRNDVLALYLKALVTIVPTAVLITITKITDARSISTWLQRK